MEKENKINAKIDNSYIKSLYFDYLNYDDRQDIENRLLTNRSIVVGFEVNEILIFCAVLDFEENKLHVREVAGHFHEQKMGAVNCYKLLNHFAKGLAEFCKYEYISFHGERPFHKKMSESFGFKSIGNDDYERKLH